MYLLQKDYDKLCGFFEDGIIDRTTFLKHSKYYESETTKEIYTVCQN